MDRFYYEGENPKDARGMVILKIDGTGKIIEFSDSALEFYGYSSEELSGKSFYDLCSEEERLLLKVKLRGVFERDLFAELTQLNKNKERIQVDLRAQGISTVEGRYVLVTIGKMDFSQKEFYNIYSEQNEVGRDILEELDKEISRSKRTGRKCALLLVEIDNLTSVRRHIGEEAMKLIMDSIRKRIRNSMRKEDVILPVSESAVGVIQTLIKTTADSSIVSSRLYRRLSEPFRLDDKELRLNVNMGISIYPDNASSSADMIANASTALDNIRMKGIGGIEVYSNPSGDSTISEIETRNRNIKSTSGSIGNPYAAYRRKRN